MESYSTNILLSTMVLCHVITVSSLCHDDEKSALLRFKDSFEYDNETYPCDQTIESWNSETEDCCKWYGVECDIETNNIISLELGGCCLFGSINSQSTLFRLVHLQNLYLGYNNFNHSILPPEIGNLTNLVTLDMPNSQLLGPVPNTLWNLTRLQILDLSENRLSGQIPPEVNRLKSIERLFLEFNNFGGTIPGNLSDLSNIRFLNLHSNNLSGSVELNMFFHLKNLSLLDLSFNKLSLLTELDKSVANKQNLLVLGLGSCNLTEFPSFLRNQNYLLSLDLSSNWIGGEIPSWFHNLSVNSLIYLNLSRNRLTGFEQHADVFRWKDLRVLDLGSNILRGIVPAAPPRTVVYLMSRNNFSGEISPSLCNSANLKALDLSFNNLTGNIPLCFARSGALSLLDLRENNLNGNIPSMWTAGCQLKMISISDNQLQGRVPKSLANCSSLQLIDFSSNRLVDRFPSWIGSLTDLRILLLRSNNFYGEVLTFGFQSLRIIDLSHNDFSGELRQFNYQNWNAMKVRSKSHQMGYMLEDLNSFTVNEVYIAYHFSMTMYNKGLELKYVKIPDILTAVDFSNNKFQGKIPEIIGDLKALYLLNLSSNNLQLNIPSSLSSLTNLESLDLSDNNLSGEIPWQLTKISSLSSFNVSFNNLSGLVPQGQQFCTFDDSSFEGNPKLVFDKPRRECGNYGTLPLPQPPSLSGPDEDETTESGFEWNWMMILMGFGSGLVVGFVAGNEFVIRKRGWLRKIIGRKSQKSRWRKNGRKNRN